MAYDPLRYEPDLALARMFYPLGYPLRIVTNSELVLQAAGESWGVYRLRRNEEPMQLRVLVEPGDEPATPPLYRGQAHLLTISGGRANFAAADAAQRFAYCRLSEAAAADRAHASYYYLEALAFHLLTQWQVAPVHCAFVVRGGVGIALCGDSGAGKSTLAYACLKHGWTYVSDNESWLVRTAQRPTLVGNPGRIRFRESAAALFPELNALTPALHANGKMSRHLSTGQTECEASVDYVVFLDRHSPSPAGFSAMPPEQAFERLLAGVPLYPAPVRAAHEEALRRLTQLPVFTMRYDSPESGIACLETLK